MALINCPECKKEVSDTAKSCPHCGFVLSAKEDLPLKVETKSTPLSELKSEPSKGNAFIAVGVVMLILTPMAFIVFFIFGIALLIGGFTLITLGIRKKGYYEVTCPYCGKSGTTGKNDENYKCTTCKKISVRDNDCLNAVDATDTIHSKH